MVTIREFQRTDEDYEQALAIHNQVWRDYPNTPEEWRARDEKRADHVKWARFFAEVGGEPVGLASYGQPLELYHPRKFWVAVDVLPTFRQQGIGRTLFQHLLTELDQYQPIELFADTREDFEDGMRFAHKLGFVDVMREYESRLDPRGVDLDEWRPCVVRVESQGIQIKTVAELTSDPARDRKLHEMIWEIQQDVPEPTQQTQIPFEEWQKIWTRPNLLPDGWFVAVDGDRYVGTSELWKSLTRPDLLYTGLTGVVRDYRRRGIAMALKVCAIRYAQQRGITRISTWNEENNRGMLGINERLGFVRQPAFVQFRKKLRMEPEAQTGEEMTA